MVSLAWLLYFGIWAISFLFVAPPKSKVLIGLLALVSLIDIAYLGFHDLRTLLFVLLATTFTICGVGRSIAMGMRLK